MIRRLSITAALLAIVAAVLVANPRREAPPAAALAPSAAKAAALEAPAPAPAMTPVQAIDVLDLPTFAKADEIRSEEGEFAYHGVKVSDHAVTFSPDSPGVRVGKLGLKPVMTGFSAGRREDGRVIYERGDCALIYAPHASGVREDLVLYSRPATDEFCWQLDVPPGMEAKLTEGGSIEVWGASDDPYSGVTCCDEKSAKLIAEARTHQTRDRLMYRLPPPVVVDSTRQTAPARYAFAENRIVVEVAGLGTLDYPVTIDPDIIVTSTPDFLLHGNNESRVDYKSAAAEIRREKTGGGPPTAWATDPGNFATARSRHGVVAFNGYLYVVGGADSGGTILADVRYSQIGGGVGGNLGPWNPTTAMSTPRASFGIAAYNDFLYVIGGETTGGTVISTVHMVPINGDGTLGTWNTGAASLPAARKFVAGFAYLGYLYAIGGTQSDGTPVNSAYYSLLRPDGLLNTWGATQAPLAVKESAVVLHNGYLVTCGGRDTANTVVSTVMSSRIMGDGSLATWVVTTPMPVAREKHCAGVLGGFIVVTGGGSGSVYKAAIGSGGEIGVWQTVPSAASFSDGRSSAGATWHNGRFMMVAGLIGATPTNTTVYCDGASGGHMTSTSAAGLTARWNNGCVAWNGYLYVIGGNTDAAETVYSTSVVYAPINPDGTFGAGVAATALPEGRSKFGCTVWNNHIYVTGGQTSTLTATTDVRYIQILTSGALAAGPWVTGPTFTTARRGHGCVMGPNGYMYVVSGESGAGVMLTDNQRLTAPIAQDGTLAGWGATNPWLAGQERSFAGCVVYRDRIYMVGGQKNGTPQNTTLRCDIGAFALTSGTFVDLGVNLSVARYKPSACVHDDILYVGAGSSTIGTNVPVASGIESAPIQSDGSIGSYVSAPNAINSPDYGGKGAVYNGNYLHAGGNVAGTLYSNCDVGRLGSNGCLDPWTTEIKTTPTSDTGPAAAVSGDFLYYGGGTVGAAAVSLSTIDGTGHLGNFGAVTSYPSARRYHKMLAFNNHLYTIGGTVGPTTCEVKHASINPLTGVLGAWSADQSTGIPVAVFQQLSAEVVQIETTPGTQKIFMYVIGGYNSVALAALNTVYVAEVNKTTGDVILPWVATSAMLTPRYGLATAIHNGHLYAMGGYQTTGSEYLNQVERAPINTNGTLGAWVAETRLPQRIWSGGGHAQDGYLYVYSGYSTSFGNSRLAWRAPLCSNGSVGTWSETVGLPEGRTYSAYAVHRGHVFSLGGSGGTANAIYRAGMLTPSAIALYSRHFDLNDGLSSTKQLISLTIAGGALPKGKVYASLRDNHLGAGTSYGYTLLNQDFMLGQTLSLGPSYNEARHVQLVLALYDGQSAPTNPDFTKERDVASVTLNYNTRPSLPFGLKQQQNDGVNTTVATGGGSNTGQVLFKATISDDVGQNVRLYVEYALKGSGVYTALPFVAGPPNTELTVTSPLFAAGSEYHWRCKAVDESVATASSVGGALGDGYAYFGGTTSINTTDFWINQTPTLPDNSIPTDVTKMNQFQTDANTRIGVGSDSFTTSIAFKAPALDPNGSLNTVALQVEVQLIGVPFANPGPAVLQNGTTFFESSFVTQGQYAVITVNSPPLVPGSSYHWQCRLIDNVNAHMTSSLVTAWVPFGLNADPGIKDFGLSTNVSPAVPDILIAGMGQMDGGTTNPVAQGGQLNGNTLRVRATLSDTNYDGLPATGDGRYVKLQMELRPVGTAFTSPSYQTFVVGGGVFFESAGGFAAPGMFQIDTGVLTDFPAVTGYHWQVRAVDDNGNPTNNGVSGWVSQGSNPDIATEIDFFVDQVNDAAPFPLPGLVQQYISDGVTVCPANGNATGVFIKATLSDPNYLDQHGAFGTALLQIQIRPFTDPLLTTATVAGFAAAMAAEPTVYFQSGLVVANDNSVTAQVQLPPSVFLGNGATLLTSYHWSLRVVDGANMPWASALPNQWEHFNLDAVPDFTLVPNSTPPDPDTLEQLLSDALTPLPTGFTGAETSPVVQQFSVLADPLNQQMRMQVELRALGDPFSASPPLTADGVNFFLTAFQPSSSLLWQIGLPAQVDGGYRWRARMINFEGGPGGWTEYGGNPTEARDFGVETVNVAPNAPTGLAQTTPPDNIPVVTGGVIIGRTVLLQAEATDPENDPVQLEFELQPAGAAFTNAPTPGMVTPAVSSGTTVVLTRNDLAIGSYQWQVRATDFGGSSSAWVQFGGAGATAFSIDATTAIVPNLPVNPQQYLPNGASVIPIGSSISVSAMLFKAALIHPLGDAVKLQIERQLVGTPFTNAPDGDSAYVNSGQTASVPVVGVPPGSYHWQCRTVDTRGAVSSWVSYGGNVEDPSPEADDFIVNTLTLAPLDPVIIGQFDDAGLNPVGVGGTHPQSAITFRAFLVDPNGDAVRLKIEVKPLGMPFDGAISGVSPLFANGSQVSVSIRGLAQSAYCWRAIAEDSTGITSNFVDYGGNLPTVEPDFVIAVSDDLVPDAPQNLAQLKIEDQAPIAVGGLADLRGVTFQSDRPDADPAVNLVRAEIEVKPAGVAFSNVPTAVGPWEFANTSGQVSMTGFAAESNWHWQASVIDSSGKRSPWSSFGGNADPGDMDFGVTLSGVTKGSAKTNCGSVGLDLLLPLGLLLLWRRLSRS